MSDTPDAIRGAAASLFAARGYAGVSVREIAKSAGADPALVIRHFGSKEKLFLETMQFDLGPHLLRDAPLENLGERFIEFVLDTDENVRGIFLALLRASDGAEIGSQLRDAHNTAFVAPLRDRLTGVDAELRARLAAAMVGGLLYSLWVVGDEELLATDHRDLVTRYGGLLQTLITPTM